MSAPSVVAAISHGLAGRCPACGEGKMFRAFLKVADNCSECGEELHHHRADDFPAYIVVTIVGHLMLSMAYYMEIGWKPALWIMFSSILPLGAILTIALIQPIKGAVVAIQWHIGTDGFSLAKAKRVLAR